MRLTLRQRAPLDTERLFPRARVESVSAERDVLGALVSGALTQRDVTDIGEALYYRAHLDALVVIEVAAESRTSRRSGIALPWLARVARVIGCAWAGAYLAACAREAPRRRDALAAVAEVRALAGEREDEERLRQRAIDAWSRWAVDAARFAVDRERDLEEAMLAEVGLKEAV